MRSRLVQSLLAFVAVLIVQAQAETYALNLPISKEQLENGETIGPGRIVGFDSTTHQVQVKTRQQTVTVRLEKLPAGLQDQLWTLVPASAKNPTTIEVNAVPALVPTTRSASETRALAAQRSQYSAMSQNTVGQQMAAASQAQSHTVSDAVAAQKEMLKPQDPTFTQTSPTKSPAKGSAASASKSPTPTAHPAEARTP